MNRRDEPTLSNPTSKAGRLQRALLKLLEEHRRDSALPTSNRFLFYELVGRGVVSKERTGARRADQDVIDASFALRERGLVPWSSIVDETRHLHVWRYAATVSDYLREVLPHARIDCWAGAPAPLLLCESRTFGGVLERTVGPEFLCPVAATNGQVGGFLRTDVAPGLVSDTGDVRAVLYIGDLDLAGDLIEQNTRRVLEREVGLLGEEDDPYLLDWQRIALTEEQIAEHELENFVIVKRDRRYNDGRPHRAVEVEALGQATVTDLVRDELEGMLPEPLERVQEREAEEREVAERELRLIGGSR